MNIKTDRKGTQLCICTRLDENKKSFFTRFDIISGWIVLGVISVFLLIADVKVLLLIVLPLILALGLVLHIAWLIKGHTYKCALRWAVTSVIGAVGGFWMIS